MKNDIYEVIFIENKDNGKINYSRIADSMNTILEPLKGIFLKEVINQHLLREQI